MTDPQITAWLDQEDADVARMIREYGWYIQFVMGDERERKTSIAYTIGMFGLGTSRAGRSWSRSRRRRRAVERSRTSREGRRQPGPGELLEFDAWAHRVTVEEIPNPGAIVFGANRHYQRPDEASVPALQLTYNDREGRFPWEPGYSVSRWIQPRPGEYTA